MTATTILTVPTTRPRLATVDRQADPPHRRARRHWPPPSRPSTTAAVASALDVSLKVGGEAIPVLGFAQLTFVAAIIGTVLAVVLSHRARRPQHTFVVTTIALTALSFVPDVLADAHTATKFMLALTHVVAAAIVIPALASRLAD